MAMSAATTTTTTTTPKDVAIKTLVFFDLETTGLPTYEFNRTKITELTLIACAVEHIRASTASTGQPAAAMPRVQHKLSLCLNPRKMIQPEATEITGLDNFMLEHQMPFSANTGALLVHFLRQLRAPVCLVAHNGDRFDFPLLRRELDRVAVPLPDGVRCVDSLTLFKTIDALETAHHEAAALSMPADSGDGDLESVLAANARIDWRKLNETTPHRGAVPPPPSPLSSMPNVVVASKRKLFASEAPTTPASKRRFRLIDVHERLFDTLPVRSHDAEADTLTLLRCVCGAREGFLELLDGESKLFADVVPLGK